MNSRKVKKEESLKIRVRGRLPFPVDMLRYDHAYPASETESGKITASLSHSESCARDIEVVVTANAAPTARRWESFGWNVVSVWNGYAWEPYEPNLHRVWR